MTIVTRTGERIQLAQGDSINEHWRNILHALPADTITRKRLAMFCLRTQAGWTLENIALAFGTHKGHVLRCVADTAAALQALSEQGPQAA